MNNKKLKFIDLFSGMGGFRIAFEAAGCKCVFSSEIDKEAVKTYELNFNDTPAGDITKIDEKEVPDPEDPTKKIKVSPIQQKIEKTIAELRENAKLSQEEAINKAWKEYIIQLLDQNQQRNGDKDGTMFKKAFVPTTCAFTFDSAHKNDWKEGNKCYVK